MAEVTNDLIFETLKNTRGRIGNLEEGQRDIKEELIAIRLHQHAAQGEINNIYSRLGTIETRLDRIETGIGIISEPAD